MFKQQLLKNVTADFFAKILQVYVGIVCSGVHF